MIWWKERRTKRGADRYLWKERRRRRRRRGSLSVCLHAMFLFILSFLVTTIRSGNIKVCELLQYIFFPKCQ